ncbi:ATP-binding protein [Clostridium tertium]|uniref:ATP-binding protein n=1 Tax=Clostridium tertium TaxID=1559 RepID=UPI001AE7E80B|nr:ATP-binding protein [Clostridium tertium]MDB1923147.1 ATP-binding protein [Clostridium tertium]MDB1926309.1 ATP-binding protein [Clostridium tertium]MDB1930077.1 ATP-binding protein [Clostridium tertium]MDU8967672.1 ATP-binding protein [Clostridium sp.]
MIKGYEKELTLIYENIRLEEEKNLEKRRNEIKQKHPDILELDNLIQKKSLNLAMSILKGLNELELKNLKEEIVDLRFKKYEALVGNGYDQEYLTLHHRCPKCKDQGYIGSTKCICYKNKLVNLYYKDSDLQDSLRLNNFNNFDLSLFSNYKISDDKYTPRKNIENILEYINGDFIPNFSKNNDNMLFYGDSGTGKTFLSCCVAKELLDKGYLVVYRSIDELIKNLREIRFENNYNLEDLLINCDLLIIDDLGAEQLTEFSATEFFNFLNKKLLKKKKMLISTNLSLPDISKNYSERISSRLLGNFKLYKFYSEDIRIQLNLKKK